VNARNLPAALGARNIARPVESVAIF